MNLLYVIATALTVSVDALVVGYSLALSSQKKLLLPITVAGVTYFMCLAASLAGTLLQGFLEGYARYLGAIILLSLGVNALRKSETNSFISHEINLSQCLITGFGVGLDGAVTNLMLVHDVSDIIFVPILFAVMHFLAIYTGQCLAKNTKLKNANVFSAVAFFLLAAMKLVDL